MTDEYANQPSIADWKFIEQLKSPLHTEIHWKRSKKKKNEISLKNGVSLEYKFSDTKKKLDTAYDDFNKFLVAGNIPSKGDYKIITTKTATSCFEEYIIDIKANSCVISAADTEGIRRGLVHLEDQITSSGGPFLAIGRINRKPFIKTRISRCFFGPIKRPPLNRDELADNVNYYPDEYLNRLVHEGINALWLSIEFRDLCPSRFFPDHGKDAQKKLAKLRQTVNQCARYGIKIYVFFNEPLGFGNEYYTLPLSSLEKNMQFAGHRYSEKLIFFCTSTKEGQEYLESCTNHIFLNVPGLGGAVAITHGEYFTNCYSYMDTIFKNNCPRCSKRKPWEVYHDTISAMSKGMKKAAPDAEFISWLYAPVLASAEYATAEQQEEALREIAAHTPKGVVMQLNFESNGKVKQFGRTMKAYDYWLAWPGPSDHFRECAVGAIKAGAGVSAKIQVGNSHENATIPFMPVPGSLYRKYKAMKELGVSSIMQCWYFGNYPGLMNKAAGELSFLPFLDDEKSFLEKLAKIDWSQDYRKVSKAWQYFMKGYSNFPITLSFTWFGPLHCSIVWPLHLFPVDQPIAPSWTFGFPDSGDRIGECIHFDYSLDEVLILLNRMDDNWQKGNKLISSIEKNYVGNHDREMDIILYKAIGLQIRSSRNNFTFYDLREKLPFIPRFMEKNEKLATLSKMRTIVFEEIENCEKMRQFCLKDPRLGFHSEAEGYKFFPAKLEWRANLLRHLLKKDFPVVQSDIENNNDIFPEYTGVSVKGKSYKCGKSETEAAIEKFDDNTTSWKSWNDGKNIYFEIEYLKSDKEGIRLEIEPRRLWPVIRYQIHPDGKVSHYSLTSLDRIKWNGSLKESGDYSVALFSIPFKTIPWFDGSKTLRVNICKFDGLFGRCSSSWIKRNPLKPRLVFDDHNSADLGFLLICGEK